MKKTQNKVNGIFIINIFIFILFSLLFAQQEQAGEKKQTEAGAISRPAINYTAEKSRDPFKAYVKIEEEKPVEVKVEVPVSPPPLTIQGIVWGGPTPVVIIDNKVAKTGDTIGEVKVVKIGKEGVTILYKNKEFILSSSVAGNLDTLR
jgi:hypothetical protein